MSHTQSFFETLTDEQLRSYLNSRWSQDRNYARQELEKRRQNRARQSNAAVEALNNRVGNVQLNNVQNSGIINAIHAQDTQLSQSILNLRNDIIRQRADYENRMRQLQTDNVSQVQAILAENAARQRAIEQEMRSQQISHEEAMQQTRIRTQEALQRMEQESQQRTAEAVRQVHSDMNSRISRVQQELSDQIAAQDRQIDQLQTAHNALVAAITTENQRREARLQRAQEYWNAANAVISEADRFNRENHHNWQEEQRNELTIQLSDVADDIANRSDQTACDNGRDLFRAAMEYRANVVAEERQWQLELSAAQDVADTTQVEIDLSRELNVRAEDENGKPYTQTIDVDYWTCGDLNRIRSNHAELQEMLKQPGLTRQQIADLHALAENYRQQVECARAYAVQAQQASIDREDMMEEAVTTVEETTGTLHREWCEYFNGDARLGRRLYLRSHTGEQIVLTVEPVVEDGMVRNSCRMEFLSYGDEVHDAHAAGQMAENLTEAMNEAGLGLSKPDCTADPQGHDPAPDHGQRDQIRWVKPADTEAVAALTQIKPVQQVPVDLIQTEHHILPNAKPARTGV